VCELGPTPAGFRVLNRHGETVKGPTALYNRALPIRFNRLNASMCVYTKVPGLFQLKINFCAFLIPPFQYSLQYPQRTALFYLLIVRPIKHMDMNYSISISFHPLSLSLSLIYVSSHTYPVSYNAHTRRKARFKSSLHIEAIATISLAGCLKGGDD